MADRSAADKKQTGKNLTIREALEAQGGSVWDAPKARPVAHNVWLRKAFDGVFSPLLFTKPALVDQRCNSLAPVAGIDWQEVAAVLTCSLFAYSLEINGSASMGAGALEAPTTKLRDYPVLNVAKLKAAERAKLVALAQDVWSSEQPLDWSKPEATPGPKLRALDDWIMKRTGRNITVATLYRDIQEVCLSRIAVAADKGKKTKKKHSENIGGVAESIAKAIRPKIQLRNFPEDFVRGEILDMNFNIDRRKVRTINVSQLLGTYDIAIIDDAGTKIFEATLLSPVAESIARSVLWALRFFAVLGRQDHEPGSFRVFEMGRSDRKECFDSNRRIRPRNRLRRRATAGNLRAPRHTSLGKRRDLAKPDQLGRSVACRIEPDLAFFLFRPRASRRPSRHAPRPGHRGIFPKSYAKGWRIKLLPFKRIG